MAIDRYFIGPRLLGDIRRTIRLVGDLPESESGATQPVRLQTLFQPTAGGGGRGVRIGTFTGSWTKNADKTVTFKYQTTTPNTVTATNLFAEISVDCGIRNCAIAKDGTAWFLISAECS